MMASGSQLREMEFTGSYKTRGDRVKVTGIFRRADPNQGVENPVTPARVARTIVSVVIAATLALLWKRARNR